MTTSNAPARRQSGAIQLPHQPAGPERVGQGTAIEQSRAAAEVVAAVIAAKQTPRDENYARILLQKACERMSVAEKAFYEFPRGRGNTVTGPTIKLAREMARCWGNVQYGVSELRRDDQYEQSEMQAFAWDLETNTRVTAMFIVPHKRDTKNGLETLTDMRDIYESNANAGARRVREAIFSVLPDWFVDEGKDLCRATLEKGEGTPLDERITNVLYAFKNDFGVTEGQLTAKRDKPVKKWGASDVAQLGVIYRSLQRKEITVDETFPAAQVTSADLTGQRRTQKPAPQTEKTQPQPTEQPPPADEPPPAEDEYAGAPSQDDIDSMWGQR